MFDELTSVLYQNLMQFKNSSFRICEDALFTNLDAFHFTKNFYLVNEFDHLIQNFDAAGLIAPIVAKYVDMNLMKPTKENRPTVLTYVHIEGFFQLFYYGCAAAIVSFMCEVIVGFIKQRNRSKLF